MTDTTPAYRIKILLDGMETSLEAWSQGKTWNGFEMPFFEEEQLRLLQAELVADPAAPQIELVKTSDGVTSCRIENPAMGEGPEIVPAVALDTVEGTKEVFAVGAGSWTWWNEQDVIDSD